MRIVFKMAYWFGLLGWDGRGKLYSALSQRKARRLRALILKEKSEKYIAVTTISRQIPASAFPLITKAKIQVTPHGDK